MATGAQTNAGAALAVTNARSAITHIALYTGDPGAAGSHANELPSSNGYARQAITWSAAGGNSVQNTNTITFTASGSWGTVTHWALVSSGTRGSGTAYARGALDAPRTVTNGVQVRFTAGTVKLQAATS